MIIERIGKAPFEIKRGDRVRYGDTNVTVVGISKATGRVKIEHDNAVRGGGRWVEKYFLYPPLPEKEEKETEKLTSVISRINTKNEPEGGWNEDDKVG